MARIGTENSRTRLLNKVGKRAFNQRQRNEFNLKAEQFDNDLRAKLTQEDDKNRTSNFLDEIKDKRQKAEKQLKLEFQLIHYIFLEDDGKISGSENRAINKHFKSYKGRISERILKALKDMTLEQSIDGIANYVLRNEYDEENIFEAIQTLRTITNSNERYNSIINNIDTKLKISSNY